MQRTLQNSGNVFSVCLLKHSSNVVYSQNVVDCFVFMRIRLGIRSIYKILRVLILKVLPIIEMRSDRVV